MTNARSVASATIWQFASQITMALLSMVTVKLVAIGLTKELAGNYNSAYGFLQLFGILADFGLYAVAVREVSRASHKGEAIGAFFVLRCCTLVVSLTSALVIVWTVPAWRGTPLPLGVTIAAMTPLFTLLAGVFRVVFQVRFKMQYVFMAEVSQRILTTALIAMLVLRGMHNSDDLRAYHLFLLIGSAGAFLLFIVSGFLATRLEPLRPVFDRERLLALLRQAAPFGIAYLCMAAYRQLDLTLIALLRPDFELQNAHYGFVLRMTEMGFLFPTFLLNSVLPLLGNPDRDRKILGGTLLSLLCLGATGALASAIWARPLVSLLTTTKYLAVGGHPGSDTALLWLSIPVFCNGLILYAFYTLLNRGAWRPLVVSLIMGAVMSVGLNFVLIPSMGFMGAATTSVVIHVALTCGLLPATLLRQPVRLPLDAVLRWALYAALLAAGLWFSLPLLTSDIRTAFGLVGFAVLALAAAQVSGLIGVAKRLRVAA